MAKINRGKKFEEQTKDAFERHGDVVIRLRDVGRGKKGVDNPCDFVSYAYPHFVCTECKSTSEGNTLPFTKIRQSQREGLQALSKYFGVVAVYFIWYIEKGVTVAVTSDAVEALARAGHKSVNIKDVVQLPCTEWCYLEGRKKRVYYEYDLSSFWDWVQRNFG